MSKRNITGKHVDEYLKLQLKLRKQNAAAKETKSLLFKMEQEIIADLPSDTTRIDGKKGSFTYNEQECGNLEDPAKFWKYVFKNKLSALVENRVSQATYREMTEAKKKIPGVKGFTRKYLTTGHKS